MVTRSLNVQITGDSRDFEKAVKRSSGALDKFGRDTSLHARITSKGFSGIGLAARGMAAGIGAAAAGAGFLTKQFVDSEKVAKQTNAVIKSTGGVANVSAKQVSDLATAISRKTGIDDEAIQSGENLLLTFTNIRNEAGKGNDIFTQATRTITDMSAALGQDTSSSAIQLGKALNDPIKGITALQRVGVSFTEKQRDQIKTLVDSGKKMEAQKMILHELNREFAGSAKAQATPFDKLKVAAGNLAESVGGLLAPALSSAAGFITDLLNDIQDGKGPIGGLIDTISHIPGDLISQFNKLKGEKGGIGAALGAMVVSGIEAIDWKSLGEKVSSGFNTALKIGGAIAENIIAAVQQVPWGTVGDKISSGFHAALDFGDKLPAQISSGLSLAFSQVNGREVLGKLVDVIGEAIDALFSPSFWIDHFKAIFAVVTLVIPVGRILKLPGFNVLFRFISGPTFRAIGAVGKGMLSLFGKAASEAGIEFLAKLETVAPKTAAFLLWLVTRAGRALGGLPGRLAGIARDAAEAVARWLGAGVGKIIGAIATWVIKANGALGRMTAKFAGTAVDAGAAVVRGIGRGIGDLASRLGSWIIGALKKVPGLIGSAAAGIGKAIVGGIKKGFDSLNPFGDGIGQIPVGGAVNLMGADPDLLPFASVGASMGLHVSDGIRAPGTRTLSGGISYHSTGDAIDEVGPMPAMHRFARAMFTRFGGRLRELISPWPELGIKDGRPFRYSPQIQAQHSGGNAHVHVAYTGPFGDGIGQAVQAARAAGFRGQALINAVAIAGAESRYDAQAFNPNYPDHSVGMWQINQLAHHGRYGSDSQLKNPFVNARAAWAISGHGRNWSPWSTWPRAAAAYMARARAAIAGTTGGSAGGGGGGPHGQSFAPDKAAGGKGSIAGVGYEGRMAIGTVAEAQARAKDNLAGLVDALVYERNAKKRRLRRINRLLRRNISRKLRTALLQEKASLIGEIDDLNDQIKEYRADARGGATTITQADELDAGVDPNAGTGSAAGGGTSGGSDLAAAMQALTDAINAQVQFGERVQATENFQLKKYIADLIGGQIVGYGVTGRSFTPGTGVEYAY